MAELKTTYQRNPPPKQLPVQVGEKDKRERRDSNQTQQDPLLDCEARRQDVYFIIPRIVKVLYGPYMYRGIMDYRTERLQGLKTILEKLGVTVELKPSPDHVNIVRVWFLDEMIFNCKMTQLVHGGDGELDPTCWEAAEALERHIRKVLKGLRKANKKISPEVLKRPFCPCFHVNDPPKPKSAESPRSRSVDTKAKALT